MHPRHPALLLVALMALTGRGPAGEPQAGSGPADGWGYRGDGSGVFPADCRPVTSWREFEGTKELEDRHGRTFTAADPESGEVMEHIVWRTPLPNMSESSPIVVGERVFTLCEPGWPVDTGDAPMLVCLDSNGGEILWRRPVDQFDAISDSERSKAKALRRRYWERMRALRDLQLRANRAIDAKDQQAMDAVADEIGELGPRAEREYRDLIGKTRTGKKNWYLFAGQDTWGAKFEGGHELSHHKKSVYGFVVPTWAYTTVGMTYATPVTDGKLIYASTAYGCTAAFTLDGEPRWVAWLFAPDSERKPSMQKCGTGSCNSPLLAEDGSVLIHRSNGWIYGVDTASGRFRWTYEFPENHTSGTASGHGEVGTGAVLDVDGTDVYVNTRGKVFRCRDGKLMADPLYESMRGMAHHSIVADRERNIIYFGSGGHSGRKEYGEHSYAVRVLPDGPDAVKGELVWRKSKEELGTYIGDTTGVLYRGRLYIAGGPIVDAATGERVGHLPRELVVAQGLVIADGRIWGGPVHHDLRVTIAPIAEDGSVGTPTVNMLGHLGPFDEEQMAKMRAYGTTRKGRWYQWATSRSYPFFSGNRVFIRTFDHMYCLGDPARPFRPSEAFAGE